MDKDPALARSVSAAMPMTHVHQMSAILRPASPSATWRQAMLALGLLLLLIVLMYRDTFGAMTAIWSRSDTFAHAYLVPPIALWLVWRRRDSLARFTPEAQPWMLVPMALVAGVWLLGDMAGVNALTQACVTALLVLAVPAVLGLAIARQILFPLCFLFFMVPVGEFLLPLMMELTADFTVAAVSLSGVPVYREGLNFIIPSGAWSVVEACSGVRYLIASFMVGTLFAYLNYRSPSRRWLFAAVSILVPVLANWIRAYMIVMLGHLSGNTIAVGVDHLIYGWVFFGIVIMLMFMVGARWSEPEAVASAPQTDVSDSRSEARTAWLVTFMAALVLLLPPVAAWRLAHPAVAPAPVLQLPEIAGTVSSPDSRLQLNPSFAGAAAQASRSYTVEGTSVVVHVALFRHQGYGAKVASSSNQLLRPDDKSWALASNVGRSTAVSNGKVVTVRVSEVVGGALAERRRIEVQQVYWVGGRFTVSDHWVTALSLWGRLTGRGDDAAVITVYTEGDRTATQPRLKAFLSTQLEVLAAALADASGAR